MKALLLDLKIFFALSFFSLMLILFDSFGLLNFPKTSLQTLTIPIQYGLYQSGEAIKKQFEFIFLIRQAALENRALKLQMGDLLSQNSDLRRSLVETQALIDQYNKLNPQTYNMLPARPLGRTRYLLIDKGADDGLKVDQVVVYRDNYMGKIISTSSRTSQVLLPQDPDSKIAVFSQNISGRARGILSGQFGSEILMDKILHQENVSVGDLVYSDGSEGKLPKGLVLGKVTRVDERQNDVFKQAKVEPVFILADLDVVFILQDL